ncbi:MAG TPA: hypothetical protein VGG61_00945, partial [Gemmataceae bacterium]
MRTFVLPLAVVLVAVAPCFAEYDVASVGPAKPKAAATTAFDAGVAATRALEKLRDFRLNGMTRLKARFPETVAPPVIDSDPAPQPTIKRGSNI